MKQTSSPSTGFLDSKTVVGHVFKKDYLTQPYIFHRGQFSPELVIGEVPITLSDEDLVSSSPNPLEKRVTVELSSRRFNVHLFMTSFVSLHAVTLKACQGTGTTLTSTRSSLFQLTCEDGCKHPLSVSLKNTKPKNMAFVLTCQFENQEQEQRGNLPLFPEATFRMVLEMKKKGSTPMSEDSDRSSRDGGNVFKKEETSETIDKRLSPTPQSFPLLDLTEKKLATITKVTSIGNVQAPSSSTYFFVIQNDFVKVSTGTSVRANAPPRAKTSEAIKLYLQHDPTTTEVSSTSHLTCSGKGYLPGYAVLFTFLCVDGCQGPISLKWMGTSAEWAPSASNFNDFASLFGIVLRCAFHDGSNWIVGQDFSIVWTFESQPKPNTEKKSENEKENNRKNNKKKKRKTN
ncbi:hypothetical protein HMI56_001180 [Coelomomyces lativittatus]|nr:hypothetical protein HMI56_001180 [Coelomomyces lativittatus]